MSYFVYILYSPSLDTYYIGQTENVQNRLLRHQKSGSKATKKAADWKLVYQEQFDTRSAAYSRETEIKKRKSRKYIERLISTVG